MIDFYKKADEKKRGEMDFVSDEVEQKIMLLLFPRKKRSRAVAPVRHEPCFAPRHRAFYDAFYETV